MQDHMMHDFWYVLFYYLRLRDNLSVTSVFELHGLNSAEAMDDSEW
jgi:hypothetical protein